MEYIGDRAQATLVLGWAACGCLQCKRATLKCWAETVCWALVPLTGGSRSTRADGSVRIEAVSSATAHTSGCHWGHRAVAT
jgi:hypothetical protein